MSEKKFLGLIKVMLMVVVIGCGVSFSTANAADKPNILLIVADDLGYTDLGSYGSEINTPNIDALAKQGVRFTNFTTSVSCSPTRSMLLTGTDNHLAGLGNMGELLTPNQKGKPGYEGYLNDRVVSLAEVLRNGGYHTYMAGKWHLGHDPESLPHTRGFESTFTLLNGGASHWKDMTGLIEAETPAHYAMNGKTIHELPEDFYSSRSYADFLINSIRQNIADGKPFLAYLAFTSPHDPLHVPEPWLSKYRGQYNDGYETLKQRRSEGAKKKGLISMKAQTPARHPMLKPWDELSNEEKALRSREMEVYAGMVDNLDYHLGRVINYLKDIGEYDNTIVIFMSDNGPNPWDTKDYPTNDQGPYMDRLDNSIENIGHPGSGAAYGMGWAMASAGPLDYFKMTTGEGGIRTPLIISGPGIQSNKIIHSFSYVTDIMPTMLEYAGISHPQKYKGKEVLPMKGRSLSDVLSGKMKYVYKPDEYIGGEMVGSRWMRKGDFKAVLVPRPYGPGEWQLYNVKNDPGETKNLAENNTELLDELKEAWGKYSKEVGVILPKS